ncbi:MAG: 50S ribosomal protein L11 methyltransferase [Clostridia bacterium]|nr:50S ribosomal protein L11 methyltransferase [Clostridia bacterium]
MKYIELTIHTTGEASEILADIMWNYTDFGVTICDAADIISLQKGVGGAYWDYIDESVTESAPTDVLVKCYLEKDVAQEVAKSILADIQNAKELSGGCIPFGTLEDTKREVDGDDWIEVWKKHFRPIHLGKIVVVPEWIEYTPQEGEKIVLLDSNMAFGTGEHETTSSCVELMQNYLKEDSICIDVGCGSGILGISALKLGAKKAYLTDIDEIAVTSSLHNAKLNGVAENAVVAHSNLLDDTDIQGDIVLANITGEILVMLAPSMPKNLKKSGVLILSGIIESRLAMVKEAYEKVGLEIIKQRQKGEWFALVLRHKA